MSEWQDKSDFEINKAVAELEGFGVDDGYGFIDSAGNLVCYDVIRKSGEAPRVIEVRVDYCSNPTDAWPIIISNEIDITSPASAGLDGEWTANKFYPVFGKTDIDIDDKNPLRAAMIVYLEMNGVKP